jgi:hypothetical protein
MNYLPENPEEYHAYCPLHPPLSHQNILRWMKKFTLDDLTQTVTHFQSKPDNPANWLYPVYYAIVWHCAQRLPIKAFRQAIQRSHVIN